VTAPDPGPCTVNSGDFHRCPTPNSQSFILDTSVVGNFYEPQDWWTICGSGTARVLLAFAGTDDSWPTGWYTGYGREEDWVGGRWVTSQGSYDVGSSFDLHGWNYMMYLAIGISGWPGSDGRAGLVQFPNSQIGVTSTVDDLACIANWESARLGCSGPFRAINLEADDSKTIASWEQFAFDVVQNLSVYGVPVPVATQMSMLPSQSEYQGGMGHWVTIVGYDSSYYYYIDTCTRSPYSCGYSPMVGKLGTDPWQDVANGWHPAGYEWRDDPTHPEYRYTWRISKDSLWAALWDYVPDYGIYAATPGGR
jgi:hypothetical protein